MGHLSHFSAPDPETAVALVEGARRRAARMGLDLLALGLPAGRPELAAIRRRFRGNVYRSVLYAVHGAELDARALGLDGSNLHVEVATL
jgi:hypothetical protein